jgi:hypothetical protein
VTASEDGKLDALGAQVADLRVLVATVAGDTRAILGRLDHHDTVHRDHEDRLRELEDHATADHEARLRALEAHGTGEHGQQIESLQRWRWFATGAAVVAGGGTGAAASVLAQLTQR